MIPAGRFTPVGAGLIPTGELRDVAGTPFDFRQPKTIGADIETENEQLALGLGYDHNWVLKDEADGELTLSARLSDARSGRVLEVWSDEPGVQFYSGNFLDCIAARGQLRDAHRVQIPDDIAMTDGTATRLIFVFFSLL